MFQSKSVDKLIVVSYELRQGRVNDYFVYLFVRTFHSLRNLEFIFTYQATIIVQKWSVIQNF